MGSLGGGSGVGRADLCPGGSGFGGEFVGWRLGREGVGGGGRIYEERCSGRGEESEEGNKHEQWYMDEDEDEGEGVSVITFSFGGFYFFSAKTKQTTPGAWWGPQAGL